MNHVILTAGIVLSAALLNGCAGNPATGGTDLVLMSESKEISIGREMHAEMMEQGSAYTDPKVTAYVDRIGQKMAKFSDRPELAYTFTVIDSENINAFALPGGYIYINRGLMSYLDNESELAGVLGHEIGHVTARHAVRQQTASVTNSILAQVAYVATGSSDLAQASNTYGTSLVRGYGREHELEADREGAAYLHRAGYDPNALLDVIGVLKDQEQYNRVRAKESGKKVQTYHGVFSTHPRNDKRLQQVITTASELGEADLAEINPAEFRNAMNGITYGKSSATAEREDNRFYHNKLNFTFAYPQEWTVQPGSRSIVTRANDQSGEMVLTIKRKEANMSDRDFLAQELRAPKLQQSAPITQEGLTGHTGVVPAANGQPARRVAIVNIGRIAYLFEGTAANGSEFALEDPYFQGIVGSFRPMKKTERQGKKQQRLEYIQADDQTTFASLASKTRIRDAENQLRLLNGYYPKGEPRAGDWIKIVVNDS